MKHVWYELIVAKASNMDLVVLFREPDEMQWFEEKFEDDVYFKGYGEYFLCLPQHAKACLHWLNGGEVEYTFANKVREFSVFPSTDTDWFSSSMWMDSDYEMRIKPKKEKRWIGVIVNNDHEVELRVRMYKSKEDAELNLGKDNFQIVEIEIEV